MKIFLIFWGDGVKIRGHDPVHNFTKRTSGTVYGETDPGFSGGGSTERYPTSILYFPVVNNDSPQKIHPNQKPVELFEYLIRTYTNQGDIVLDNCIGSGTTAVA
jgi:site-specific DNA-methyltransferase (adenine-specific)